MFYVLSWNFFICHFVSVINRANAKKWFVFKFDKASLKRGIFTVNHVERNGNRRQNCK